jgi:hypothetical protein
MSIKCDRCNRPLKDMAVGVFKDEKGYGIYLHRGCDCGGDPAIAERNETTNAIWLKFRLEGCKVIDSRGNTVEVDPKKVLTLDYAPDGSLLEELRIEEAPEPIESIVPDDLPRCSNCEAWLDGRPAGEKRGFCCTLIAYTSPEGACKYFTPGRRICERCHFWINDQPTEPKGYCSHLETRIEAEGGCIDFKRRIE